jgi:predicted Zn-dependent peptidase
VPAEAVSSSMDQLDKKLETLKEWKDEGLITDEEFAKEKARIIEKLHGL